jgi:hypothetical protein
MRASRDGTTSMTGERPYGQVLRHKGDGDIMMSLGVPHDRGYGLSHWMVGISDPDSYAEGGEIYSYPASLITDDWEVIDE